MLEEDFVERQRLDQEQEEDQERWGITVFPETILIGFHLFLCFALSNKVREKERETSTVLICLLFFSKTGSKSF